MACLLKNEPASCQITAVKIKVFCSVIVVKASLKRAIRSFLADPKPGELTMGRVNPAERRGEGPNP